MLPARAQTFCGRAFSRQEVALVQEIVETCGGVSFTELAHTVCELLEWKRRSCGFAPCTPVMTSTSTGPSVRPGNTNGTIKPSTKTAMCRPP